MLRGTDVVVVGGGLAGSLFAVEAARAGRSVVLLEKSKEAHDKVCGEFLSSEALHYLERAGLDLTGAGDAGRDGAGAGLGAVPIRRVRLMAAGMEREAELPFAALSLSRRVLDEALLECAGLAGATVHRDAGVESLQRIGEQWSAHLRDGRRFLAGTAVLATGKHDLRGFARPLGKQNDLVAFKMYYTLDAAQHRALGDAVELHVFPDGYAGLQPVEGGRVNLCLLLRASRLRTLESPWSGVRAHLDACAPKLAARLEGATPLLRAPLAASQIPYGHVQRPVQDGLWRLGDQAAVIPSFCGEGMSIALHSGAFAAQQYLQGASAAAFQQRLRSQLRWRVSVATMLSRMLVESPRMVQAARFAPSLLTAIASLTRIPQCVLLAGAMERA